MKKLIFGLIATVLFGSSSFGQISFDDWKKMMVNFNSNVNSTLILECPKGTDFESFKKRALSGEITITSDSEKQIKEYSLPVRNYAKNLAQIHKIDISDFTEDELTLLGGIFPPNIIDVGDSISFESLNTTAKVGESDWFNCGMEALGVNLFGELISNGISNLPKSAIRKFLKKFATRYLGAIGAAVAIYEFGDCMDWW